MNTVSLPEPPKTAVEIHEALVKWVESNPKVWYGNPLLQSAADLIEKQAIRIANLDGERVPDFYQGRAPMGYCPHCSTPSISREKRPDGNDTCQKGHCYPSAASLRTLKD